jgi:hypothetical protein
MENMVRKTILVVVVILGTFLISSACSSSRKMKKKCRDCPEFSLEEKFNTDTAKFDEQV